MKRIRLQAYQKLSQEMWQYYDTQGRGNLPWRVRCSPYRVVVSEIMLQQTQVARVEQYFKDWMRKYPSWRALAEAPLRDVLLSWQGLGYNRRGKYLHDTAQIVVGQFKGTLPQDRKTLESMPGIGPYTAGAIRAFAFDQNDVFLETNIRTVLFYHCYRYQSLSIKSVSDTELLSVLQKYIATDSRAQNNPRELYYAMMDYGSYIKKQIGNLNKQSQSYTQQSRFEGSRRQLRSRILRYILLHGRVSEQKIIQQSLSDPAVVVELLRELTKEGSVSKQGRSYFV